MSILTGESDPKTVQKGMDLLAGSRVFSNEIEIQVKLSGEETYLGQILNEVKNLQQKRTPLVFMSDKASQILLSLVLGLAAIFFISYYSTDSKAAFERSLALVVVACPCALALGTPMALSQALKRATKLGIVIRSPDVFEKIPKIKAAAFDKTGTLTQVIIRFQIPSKICCVFQIYFLSAFFH
jgi:Cu2+-exporting ATPase/Cu+-exporting ATPase